MLSSRRKSTVSQLLEESQFVVLHAGDSEGVLWELGEILKTVDPLKVVIGLPLAEKGGDAAERANYEKFRDRTVRIFPHALPEEFTGAQFLYFDRDWNRSVVRYKR